MTIKISLCLAILLICGIIMLGCDQNQTAPIEDPTPISGLIYELGENTILVVDGISDVNTPRDDWFEGGKRAVYFTINEHTVIEFAGNAVSAESLARGQKVEIYHEGFLAESYPEQGGAQRVVIIDDTPAAEYQTDSGRFMGYVEDNSIEIKISGIPDELPGRLFRLTAEARDHLDRLNLEAEEVIIFYYLPDENFEGLIFDLSRIIN